MIFLYLPEPAEIDGESEHVEQVVLQGLHETAGTMGDYVAAAFVQLRAADLGRIPGEFPEDVQEWEDSPRGEAIIDVRRRAAAFVAAVRRLQDLN